MVNKAALGVLAVVVIAVVGVGMLVGTFLGGDANPVNDDDGGAEGPTATETTTELPPNATITITPGEATRTPMLPRRFESAAIAENITRLINEERENESIEPLSARGETANALREMAEGHSVDMADAGYVAHNVSRSNVSQRYRANGLFDTCKYADHANVYRPDNTDRFEVVGAGTVGQYYELEGNRTFIENESLAAQIVVNDWLSDRDEREYLLTEEFRRLGVGVEITRESTVYVTVNLCS